MRRSSLRRAALVALPLALIVGGGAVASANPEPGLNPQYGIFVVKDLGGGAYWNVTTSSMYLLQEGSGVLIDAASTTADLLATTAANGRDLLLLINGAVLVPVTEALGG